MANSKTIGITFSTFDLLHAGHVSMLREAKSQCDYLICGIQSDPTIDRPKTKNKPVQTLVERYVRSAGAVVAVLNHPLGGGRVSDGALKVQDVHLAERSRLYDPH